jgi:predicted nucleic acid-binding protein
MLFVDTNVLLAACDTSRAAHASCLELLEAGLRGSCSLFASGQIFREYLVVATRPVNVNGLGMPAATALANLDEFSRCVRLLDETAATSDRLRSLVREHDLSGKRIHDANVVATMLENGLGRIVTHNPEDYQAFSGIEVLTAAAAG